MKLNTTIMTQSIICNVHTNFLFQVHKVVANLVKLFARLQCLFVELLYFLLDWIYF